jgi:hypothetical protein
MRIRDLVLILKGYNKFSYLGCLALAEYILNHNIKDIKDIVARSFQAEDYDLPEKYEAVLSGNNVFIFVTKQ